MKIVDYNTVRQNMSGTRTVQDFGKFLGEKPFRLGTVATLYPHLALTNLTDKLMNIYEVPKNGMQSSYSTKVEWTIDVLKIKTVKLVADVTTTGANGQEMVFMMEERYFEPTETFVSKKTRQQFIVLYPPVKHAINKWEYRCRYITTDISRGADLNGLKAGELMRFRSNYNPELSEKGYSKYVSNAELHRNYISLHRASVPFSGQYALQENTFIETAKGGEVQYYKLSPKEKECLDHFVLSRNNNITFGESNHTIDGKCLIQTPDGRDIPMGDGVERQINRVCDKFVFSKLTTDTFDEAIAAMKRQSDSPKGNHYVVLCNERMDQLAGRVLRDYLKGFAIDGTYFFSKAASENPSYKGDSVKVGADYDSYMIQGNRITFISDRALSIEYPDTAYGIFIDAGKDQNSGRANIALYTLEGAEMVTGNFNGMGGATGKASGPIASTVHGGSYELLGYACAVVHNPYKSFILKESTI